MLCGLCVDVVVDGGVDPNLVPSGGSDVGGYAICRRGVASIGYAVGDFRVDG